MDPTEDRTIHLENDLVSLIVDPVGGAITSFRLKQTDVNPLSFSFSKEQMPSNNKAGANYQGHFLCLGRWGEPSPGEVQAGMPNHGEAANIDWQVKASIRTKLQMEVTAAKEGLHVKRTIEMDSVSPVYMVEETVTNINLLGRMFNIVQHPTIASPFLDAETLINCNARKGFDQAKYKQAISDVIEWPNAKGEAGKLISLSNPDFNYSSVYSFVVDQSSEYGWIIAFSEKYQLMFGYLWKRSDYPWIHLWQHYEDNKIRYRGMEFGTAGIHQPFNEILETATTLFGEKTYAYIDAGESISKKYGSFIHPIPERFTGVENVYLVENNLIIKTSGDSNDIIIKLEKELIL